VTYPLTQALLPQQTLQGTPGCYTCMT
jgi:hypothetical protein